METLSHELRLALLSERLSQVAVNLNALGHFQQAHTLANRAFGLAESLAELTGVPRPNPDPYRQHLSRVDLAAELLASSGSLPTSAIAEELDTSEGMVTKLLATDRHQRFKRERSGSGPTWVWLWSLR